MAFSSRCTLPLVLLLLLISAATGAPVPPSSSHPGAYRPSISHKNIVTLLGDASIENGIISLTCASRECSGVGRALYSNPVRLREPGTDRALSFSSNFTFSINPLDGEFGDGLAFLITSDSSHHGSSHGYMGIFYNERSTTGSHRNHGYLSREKKHGGSGIKTVAVEFDTTQNKGDINGNHVALDVGSISAVASADAEAAGVGLKSGKKMRAWVEYNGDKKELLVWLSHGHARPRVPLLRTIVDLSGFLHDDMFIGFSASNGRGAARHVVEEWRFQTSPLTAAKATSTTSSSPRRWSTLYLGLGIGFAAALTLLVIAGCIAYCCRCLGGDGSSRDLEKAVDQEKALDLENPLEKHQWAVRSGYSWHA